MTDIDSQTVFNLWLCNNAQLYRTFVQTALRAKQKGFKRRWSVQAIMEIMRWETGSADSEGEYKINHNIRAFVARKAMAEVPELADFFETRRSRFFPDEA